MTIDPSDPATFEDDEEVTEFDVEAPEADAAEQHADIAPRRDGPQPPPAPDSANEADLLEQARIVEEEEDEYR
ncbi:hypothetical protein [Streptomyces syringium]|uniref:hypothetical protein n=1 Tax=Streptomyces syringium TaxID=76729 RepID=UPI003415B7B9